jgi:hypothetical protein
MSRLPTLNLPDQVDRALKDEAARTGKSTQEVALDWIGPHVPRPVRGSVDALMPSLGAWSMTPAERAAIEQMIGDGRLLSPSH